jgi:hypothetical protein
MSLKPFNRGNYIIKDNQGFIKYNQKLYIVFGIVCITIAILSYFKITNGSIFGVLVSFCILIISLINSISIKKYIKQR